MSIPLTDTFSFSCRTGVEMIAVVCFKWKRRGRGFVLPSQQQGFDYGPAHVNTLFKMLRRHSQVPFEAVCITDDSGGLDRSIRTIPLWDKCLDLGGCFNRLYLFSRDMRALIGPRFVCMDIDCVVTGDVTAILTRPEPFVINSYQPPGDNNHAEQLYNGSLVVMDAGCRERVWTEFDPATHPLKLQGRNDRMGTDQAWIREILGPRERRLGCDDGVYEARNIGDKLPKDARLVFFSGKRDPTTSGFDWIETHYW
jgi:hypothetical protein